jgi:polar amino acid transport system substrate-binding protein
MRIQSLLGTAALLVASLFTPTAHADQLADIKKKGEIVSGVQ